MTTVVEQTKGPESREQGRKSRPILMQQIEQGMSRSYTAVDLWARATDVAWLRGFSGS